MSKKFFILKNINPLKIEKNFNIKLISNFISTFSHTGSDVGMKTILKVEDIQPPSLPIDTTPTWKSKCFWCRNYYAASPIGIPIRYIPDVDTKVYKSALSNETYTFRKISISDKKLGIFEVDGYFCSFPCCYAYYMENKNNPLYKSSEELLLLMYKEMNGAGQLQRAPSWRLLNDYGGNMTIEQFRKLNNIFTEVISSNLIKLLFTEHTYI